jgi:glycosyltransferase involved in cell wall biosynthesis
MTAAPTGTAAPPSLESRLRAAARVLFASRPDVETADPGTLLDLLVRDVQSELRADRMWLLSVAVATILPSADDVRRGLRALELRPADEAAIWLLDEWARRTGEQGTPRRNMTIVSEQVLVDVDFTARHELHTGIQRVVRSLLPRWVRDHQILPVVWAPRFGSYRTLTSAETERLLRWDTWHREYTDDLAVAPPDEAEWSLVVPWRCTVVLAEVPPRAASASLAGLAQMSGNTVVGIGYDAIPIVNAPLLPVVEPDRFLDYLTIVKHMRRIAAISVSAADEFLGFADMLSTQGLIGPNVVECLLPSPAHTVEQTVDPGPDPLVVSVGSYEPRKNQLATLHAAETLWREGLRFRLTFVGGGGWGTEFPAAVRRLARKGRPVVAARAISDDQLNALYAQARFTVFASLHEGYGLPVAESLAHGTPVITTEYGSTGEIAAGGGALLIDPRDDLALIDAMRDLLTDESHLAKLHDAINTRQARDWDDYARELWHILVSGEMVTSS